MTGLNVIILVAQVQADQNTQKNNDRTL